MGTRCLLLRSRLQNDPGPVPVPAGPLPGARGSDSSFEVSQAGTQEDTSNASLFEERWMYVHAINETINTFRLIGGMLGVAILVSVLTEHLHTGLEQASRTAGALAHVPVIDAFRTTWLFAALC